MGSETDVVRVEASVPLGVADAYALLVDGRDGWWPAGTDALDLAAQDPPRTASGTWAADGSEVVLRVAPVGDDLTTVIVEHRYRARAVRAWAAGDDGWWGVLRAYVGAARAAQSA
jgi:hypothetical protein